MTIDNLKQRLYAQKFGMWIGVASLSMVFAGLTSAYIVKKADTVMWNVFEIPSAFIWSTITILLSSLTMRMAIKASKSFEVAKYRLGVLLTLVLGLVFCVFQSIGWSAMYDTGIFLREDIAGAFFYVITGLHVLHVLGGIVVLLLTLIAVRNTKKIELKLDAEEYQLKFKNSASLVSIYWHFVDLLWLYLYGFLLMNHI